VPVELLLELVNESDTLPEDAEPALEADEPALEAADAKLSARHGVADAAHSKAMQPRRKVVKFIEAPRVCHQHQCCGQHNSPDPRELHADGPTAQLVADATAHSAGARRPALFHALQTNAARSAKRCRYSLARRGNRLVRMT